MELYTYYRSSASYRVRIAMNLKGLTFEPRYVHLRKGEQSAADYLSTNPNGLVPTLVDDGFVLSQSLAIIEYLEEIHPRPPLLPADTQDRAMVRAVANAIACDIHPLNNLRVLRYLGKELGHDEATRDTWYRHWVAQGLPAIEQQVNAYGHAGQFLVGDTPTLADICLVPQIYNAERFNCDLSGCPTLTRVNANCLALDAFARAVPEAQPDADA